MTQYNSLNVNSSSSQFCKLKATMKNESEVVSKDNFDGETNFLHKLLLTDRQVTNLCKAVSDNSSVDVKLSKTELSKIIKSRRFLGRLLGSFLKVGLPLMQNVLQQLAKRMLIPLKLTATVSAADAGIHKKTLESGGTISRISSEKMKDIMKTVRFLEHSRFLIKRSKRTKRWISWYVIRYTSCKFIRKYADRTSSK